MNGKKASVVALGLLGLAGATVIAGKTLYEKYGDELLKDSVVRCHDGHLYTSIWLPMVSFKAARLGKRRYQYCPIGHHWSLTMVVEPSSLTPEMAAQAAMYRDKRVP